MPIAHHVTGRAASHQVQALKSQQVAGIVVKESVMAHQFQHHQFSDSRGYQVGGAGKAAQVSPKTEGQNHV